MATDPITRNQVLCVSTEAVYGTGDAAFLANPEHFAQLVHDVRFIPTVLKYDRPIQTTMQARNFGAIKALAGGRLTGWIEMRGRGEAVTNAKKGQMDPWLRACGMACGAWAAGWPYTTSVGGALRIDGESISVLWNSAGCKFLALGGRGNPRLVYAPGQVGRLEFDIVFPSLAISDGALTVPEYTTAANAYMDVSPGLVQNLALTWLDETYRKPRGFTIDLRNQVAAVPVLAEATPTITRILGRGPASDQGAAITIDVEAGDDALVMANWTELLSADPVGAFPASSATITDASGNDVVVAFGAVEVVGVTRGSSGDLITETVEGRLRATAFGAEDDLTITITA